MGMPTIPLDSLLPIEQKILINAGFNIITDTLANVNTRIRQLKREIARESKSSFLARAGIYLGISLHPTAKKNEVLKDISTVFFQVLKRTEPKRKYVF